MTRALDRYVLRGFVAALLVALIAFVAIFVVFDLFEKMDDYLDRSVPVPVIFHYYLARIPEILLLMLPVGMLLACLFTLGGHARNNEFVATVAAGVRMRRTLAPVLIASLLISIGALAVGEVIAPPAAARAKRIYDEKIKPGRNRIGRLRTDVSYLAESGLLFRIGKLDLRKRRMENVEVQRLEKNRLIERIDAREATWANGVWTFRDGFFRSFSSGRLVEEIRFDVRPAPSIEERPEDFAKVAKSPKQMSYRELAAFIAKVEATGGEARKEKVDLNMKLAFPFTSFLIVLFGSPLASLLRRGGNAIGFTLALLICFVYYLAIRVGQAFGYNGKLPPLLGAWAGNLLFLVIGNALFRRLVDR